MQINLMKMWNAENVLTVPKAVNASITETTTMVGSKLAWRLLRGIQNFHEDAAWVQQEILESEHIKYHWD